MPYFLYGPKEIAHLSKRCKKMGALIERLGSLRRATHDDLFEALVTSILSQQISSKAAATICGRLTAKTGSVTPASVHALSLMDVQSCGTSLRKAGYIKAIAESALHGDLDMSILRNLPDADVIKRLSALKGVGVWTAEMLLIFALQRPDVISWLDLGIRKGMMALYGKKELTPTQFALYRKRYAPYGTVASLYLWELAGQPGILT